MRSFWLLKRPLGIAFVMLCVSALPWNKVATAAEDAQYKTANGLAVYLGVVPAEIVKGHPSGHAETTMHGGHRQVATSIMLSRRSLTPAEVRQTVRSHPVRCFRGASAAAGRAGYRSLNH